MSHRRRPMTAAEAEHYRRKVDHVRTTLINLQNQLSHHYTVSHKIIRSLSKMGIILDSIDVDLFIQPPDTP